MVGVVTTEDSVDDWPWSSEHVLSLSWVDTDQHLQLLSETVIIMISVMGSDQWQQLDKNNHVTLSPGLQDQVCVQWRHSPGQGETSSSSSSPCSSSWTAEVSQISVSRSETSSAVRDIKTDPGEGEEQILLLCNNSVRASLSCPQDSNVQNNIYLSKRCLSTTLGQWPTQCQHHLISSNSRMFSHRHSNHEKYFSNWPTIFQKMSAPPSHSSPLNHHPVQLSRSVPSYNHSPSCSSHIKTHNHRKLSRVETGMKMMNRDAEMMKQKQRRERARSASALLRQEAHAHGGKRSKQDLNRSVKIKDQFYSLFLKKTQFTLYSILTSGLHPFQWVKCKIFCVSGILIINWRMRQTALHLRVIQKIIFMKKSTVIISVQLMKSPLTTSCWGSALRDRGISSSMEARDGILATWLDDHPRFVCG